jgi:flagellar basal body-associated protein FliL
MTEDPLERIEREERERKERNGGLKTTTIILAVVALALAGALAWIWSQKSGLVHELEGEKAELTEQLLHLQSDFENLNSDYESINSQLDTSREQVALLIDKLSKTEATNRAKIRQYEKELGTLRSIMRGYIVQIDSLNTLNKKLTADAAAARQEAAESRRANENLTRQVENLSGQVAAGAVIKARGLHVNAYNGSDKVTDRSSRVTYLVATLSLVENEIAERGPVRVYVRVTDPNGNVLQNASSTTATIGGTPVATSASREVDYEGQEVEMSIYVKDVGEFVKGIYTVEAYTVNGQVGRAELMLR